jgi:hypothetical protein
MKVFETPAGVKIGMLYRRPMPTLDADSRMVQRALLSSETKRPRPWYMRLVGRVVKWL